MVKINTGKRIIIGLLLFVMILGTGIVPSRVANAVTISDQSYSVRIKGENIFLSNKTALNTELGTDFYMMYTVDSVSKFTMNQQGVVGSVDPTQALPFLKGGFMRWSRIEANSLMVEGATYFIKCEAANGSFLYDITRVKDGVKEKLIMDEQMGWPKTGFSHYGLYVEGAVEATLSNVHCYDAKGNDLGVMITEKQGEVVPDITLTKNKKMKNYYDIKVDKRYCVNLSNLHPASGKKVYMEYSVESAEGVVSQEGVVMSDSPHATYAYQDGTMRYTTYTQGAQTPILLEPGADYILAMERVDGGFYLWIQKTKGGVTSTHSFQTYSRFSPNENAKFFSLWFGDWAQYEVSFHLTNFKCYDEKNQDLGVQTNVISEIKRYGEVDGYAGCEAVYYCKETKESIALYENQGVRYTEEGKVKEATYRIVNNLMEINGEDGKKSYKYMYQKITDDAGNVYKRLGTYKITFANTGKDKIPAQELSRVNGYLVKKPEDPVVEGKEFEAWYTGNGKLFDFNQIVTKSTTLYAKYVGEELQVSGGKAVPVVPIIIGGICIALSGVGIVFTVKRGKKDAGNMEE